MVASASADLLFYSQGLSRSLQHPMIFSDTLRSGRVSDHAVSALRPANMPIIVWFSSNCYRQKLSTYARSTLADSLE
jgi:hypothetical protein